MRGYLACVCSSPTSACGCARARVLNGWDKTVERREEETPQKLRGRRDDNACAVAAALRWALLSRIAFAIFEGDGGQHWCQRKPRGPGWRWRKSRGSSLRPMTSRPSESRPNAWKRKGLEVERLEVEHLETERLDVERLHSRCRGGRPVLGMRLDEAPVSRHRLQCSGPKVLSRCGPTRNFGLGMRLDEAPVSRHRLQCSGPKVLGRCGPTRNFGLTRPDTGL